MLVYKKKNGLCQKCQYMYIYKLSFFLLQSFADYMYVIINWTIYKKLNKNG